MSARPSSCRDSSSPAATSLQPRKKKPRSNSQDFACLPMPTVADETASSLFDIAVLQAPHARRLRPAGRHLIAAVHSGVDPRWLQRSPLHRKSRNVLAGAVFSRCTLLLAARMRPHRRIARSPGGHSSSPARRWFTCLYPSVPAICSLLVAIPLAVSRGGSPWRHFG